MDENKIKTDEEQIDLGEIFMIFIRRKWLFIGSVLMMLIVGLSYVFMQPASYLLTYQIEVKEKYFKDNLLDLYPNYEKELNYISLKNFPIIFKSVKKYESVEISLNEGTSIFNISISNPDYDLADKIAKNLIDAADNSIKNKGKTTFNQILGKIELDIKILENENENYENIIIADLEDELESLYAELDRYIVDYNVGLFDELVKNKNTENVSFNVIIPPNNIKNKISDLRKNQGVYIERILENKKKIIALNNLRGSLLKDENIILNRINLVSENPSYERKSNRLRNTIMSVVVAIIVGTIFTFFINFLLGLKIRLKNK